MGNNSSNPYGLHSCVIHTVSETNTHARVLPAQLTCWAYSQRLIVQLTLTRWPMAWALDFLTPALRSNSPVVSAVSSLPEAM